jgi:Cof subfamily protein (haloacid dehalogenase superfamily)
MLNVSRTESDKTITFHVKGRIDSNTAKEFEDWIFEEPVDNADTIVLDFQEMDFISSAGLRVLLMLRNRLPESVSLEAHHVSAAVQDVFDLTGFADIITVKNSDVMKQKISAVFFDIDGTLLSHRTGTVPESTRQAIFKLRENGIHAIICTGRVLEEMEKLPIMDLPFDGYLTLNGNLCLDENKKLFAGIPIDQGEVDILVRIFKASKIPFVLIGENNRYINYVDDIVIDTQANTKGTIPDIGEYKGEKIYQCLAFVKSRERLMLENMLDECSITSWNETGIDIISKHGGKAKGLAKFIERYGLRPGETMAFGDGENDIDMIRFAGIGVAMGNAIKNLKSAADYITTDIDDDGIANALQHFGLID